MMPPAGLPRPDAASRNGARRLARVHARCRRARQSESGPPARASPESRRVRECRSRSARARCRRHVDAAAGRFERRVRQQRRRARRVAGAARKLPERRRAHQRAGARRSEDAADRRAVPRPAGRVAGSPHRRSPARHDRRHPAADATLPLDGEYQFQVRLFRTNLGTTRGLEYPHQLEISVDGERVHLASFGGDKEIAASSDNPTTTGDAVDGRFTARVPLKAGPRTITRGVPREDARAEHAAARKLRAQLVGHDRLLGQPAHRRSDPHRAVQSDRLRRHAEPAADLHVPSEDGGRRRGLRAEDPRRRWRGARIAAT